jgi:hypothetical protein
MNNNEGRVTPQVVRQGDLYEDSDPVVKRFPANFEDVEVHVSQRKERQQSNVEAATAAPGERRTRTEPAKRASRSRKKADEKPPEQTEEEQARQLGLVDPDDPDNA